MMTMMTITIGVTGPGGAMMMTITTTMMMTMMMTKVASPAVPATPHLPAQWPPRRTDYSATGCPQKFK
jgi:hypothetical protein